MKNFFSRILLFSLFFLLSIPTLATTAVPEKILDSTASVVKIVAKYDDEFVTGSGFVVKSTPTSTYIVTNYHVLEDNPYDISVWVGQNSVYAKIYASSTQKDLCILEIPASDLKPLSLAEKSASQGEIVYAIGYPGAAEYLSDQELHSGNDATITNGIVSAIRTVSIVPYGPSIPVLQINAAINHGNSGGPLFNVDGKVIGVATYGIDDAQGIYGAISSTEVLAFLTESGISTHTNNFLWFCLIAMAITIVVLLIWEVFRIVKRKLYSAKKEIFVEELLLAEFMKSYPHGIGIEQAVSMLLPAALQLRDLHNNGSVHLELSPNSISVGKNGAIILDSKHLEAHRYTSGFAAPEIYGGTSYGISSDIYSLCALLYYVSSGHVPQNALERSQQDLAFADITFGDAAFTKILESGMALQPQMRYRSVVELIHVLARYNTVPFLMNDGASDKTSEFSETTPKKYISKKRIKFLVISLPVLLLIGYLCCYLGSIYCMSIQKFDTADNLLLVPGLTSLHDSKLLSYVNAGTKLQSGQYTEAAEAFQSLGAYRQAPNLEREAYYRLAEKNANAANFKIAIEIYTELAEQHYKDSEEKLQETTFRHAMYQLYEEENYARSISMFQDLAEANYPGAEEMVTEARYLFGCHYIDVGNYINAFNIFQDIINYSNVSEIIRDLKEMIYLEGQEFYRNSKFNSAAENFKRVHPYKQTDDYLLLIEFKTWHADSSDIPELLKILDFEDAGKALFWNHWTAKDFLQGTWKTDDYSYYFTMQEDGHITYNLPWFNYGDYYNIQNGDLVLYPDENRDAIRQMYSFAALSENCIKVYCYKDSSVHVLYRQ